MSGYPQTPMLIRFLTFGSLLPFVLCAQIEIDLIDIEDPASEGISEQIPDPSSPTGDVEDNKDTLVFLNGNKLVGELDSVNEETLEWIHPDVKDPIMFSLDNIEHVHLNVDRQAEAELRALPKITLTNGDTVRGEILEYDAERLLLDSPVMGPVDMDARMVDSIAPQAVSSSLYEGPTLDDSWTFESLRGNDETWFFHEGALYARDRDLSAKLALEDLPDQVSISMDLEWKGALNFTLGFWGQNTNNPNTNAYALSLQNTYIRVYRSYQNAGRNNFFNQHMQDLFKEGKTSLTLFLDQPNQKFILLLDGKIIGQWKDHLEGVMLGNEFLMYTQSVATIRASNIRIDPWDGELELDEDVDENSQDRMTTTTGDSFSGELLSILDNTASFRNEFAEFTVPIDRVSHIAFSSDSRATPRLMAGDVQLLTLNGEAVTLKLNQLENGVMQASSETTGDVQVALEYFAGIRFNLYDERHNEEQFSW